MPGDFYVAFIGRLNTGSIPRLLLAWLGIIAVVVAGSTNLYLGIVIVALAVTLVFAWRRWGLSRAVSA